MRERLLKTKDQGRFPRYLQLLCLFTLLFTLPSSAWADYTYGGETLYFYYPNDTDPMYYYSGSEDNKVIEWNAKLYGGGSYQGNTYTGFTDLRFTYVKPLTGLLSGITIGPGQESALQNATITVYKLATPDATERTKIGTISIESTLYYTYNPIDGVQGLYGEYIQLGIETNNGATDQRFLVNEIKSITLSFSGNRYGLTVAGVQVTSFNAANVLNDDYSSVSYDAENNILTLKGAHLNSGSNGISTSSDLNINLVGYSNVGTINVTSGTLNFTTSTTLPGCLKTNITGNSTITYGAGTGLSWDGTMVKSSNTNPYIIYATGYKGDNDEYGIDNGDIVGYSNEGSVEEIDVSSDVTVVNSQNNASIDYFKVSSASGSPTCYIYPADLNDMNLVTKAYLLFDWGTCTNKDVKVQVRGLKSDYTNDGNYSDEVSLPSDGGLVEIPLTGVINSYYVQLYFSSTTDEFSFVPISVGFLKTEMTIAGVALTSSNASNITGDGTVSYDVSSKTLTLSNATIEGGIVWSGSDDLKIALNGVSSITNTEGEAIKCTYTTESPTLTFTKTESATNCQLTLTPKDGSHPIDGFEIGNGLSCLLGNLKTGALAVVGNYLFGGGDGSEDAPYLITSKEELKELATYIYPPYELVTQGKYFKLSPTSGTIIDCDGLTGFQPIGFGGNPFKGTFYGNNCTIKNLSVSGGDVGFDSAGLFGPVDGGTIKDLTLKDCSITGKDYAGGIAGPVYSGNFSNLTLEDCTIKGVRYAGGIAGYFGDGKIEKTLVKGGSITTTGNDSKAGAIIGYYDDENHNGELSDNKYTFGVTVTVGVEKTGYTHRGVGTKEEDVIGGYELDGTTLVTIVSDGDFDATEGTYYMFNDGTYYVLPNYALTLKCYPTQDQKPRLTLSDATIEVTAEEITDADTGDYDHTEFTFTVGTTYPTDLTATLTFPTDIASATFITASIADGLYTGDPVVPTQMTLNDGTDDYNLTTANDFTITGYTLGGTPVDEPIEVGTYTVSVEGKGNYTGTRDVSYKIIQTYALKIAGTQVNENNAANVLGSAGTATVSFTPATATTPNILTLNDATINGTIESSLGDLTIHLTGDNILKAPVSTTSITSLINSTNGGTLTFETDANTIGSLSFQESIGGPFANTPWSGFTSGVVYTSGLDYLSNDDVNMVGLIEYPLTIGGTTVTSANKTNVMNDGKISYNTESNTLTLNGVAITGSIEYNGTEDLTIALNGINSVTKTDGTYAIYTNGGKLNFVKADGATSAELTAICGDGYIAIEPSSSTLGSGLYWKPIAANNTIITEDPEFVIIEDYIMTDTRTINGTTGTITFNSTDKVLTITGFHNEFESHAIKTGINGLKVKLVGSSAIICEEDDIYAFHAVAGTGASIQFVKDDDTSMLTMTTAEDSPFDGFSDGKITYNGLVYYPTEKYIAVPTALTMAEENKKVKLTKDYDDGDIYYTIDYADETADVAKTKYTAEFAMAAPGTVEAWVEANGATTSSVKGKYFGYKNAPFKIKVGDTQTLELIPAFVDGENIDYNTADTYESSDTDVATFTDGTITGTGIGTATLTANINYTADVTPVVILNPNKKVTAEVSVGMIPDITFPEGMTYATYCNTTGFDLTVPEGLTAYAITGTNGNVVTLAEMNFLPKVDGTSYVALLLKRNNTNTTVGLAFVSAGGTLPISNYLHYAITNIDVEDNWYVLYKNEFVKATGTIPAGKCYLSGIVSPARSLGIEDDGTTDIHIVNSEEGIVNGGVWYDLQGRRIEQPTKAGLYIKNGKKVVINK